MVWSLSFCAGMRRPNGGVRAYVAVLTRCECTYSAEPSIQAATLGIGQVLIIATDGVWDVVEDSYAVELALYHQPDGQEGAELAAQELVQDARAIWEQREGSEQTIDDISAVVAFLP